MEYFIYLPAAGILLLAAFIAVKKLKRTGRQFNRKTPLTIVKKEAENDNPDAILELAYRYAEGYGGCEKNEEKAVEQDSKSAQESLTMHIGEFRKQAAQGYKPAQEVLKKIEKDFPSILPQNH